MESVSRMPQFFAFAMAPSWKPEWAVIHPTIGPDAFGYHASEGLVLSVSQGIDFSQQGGTTGEACPTTDVPAVGDTRAVRVPAHLTCGRIADYENGGTASLGIIADLLLEPGP